MPGSASDSGLPATNRYRYRYIDVTPRSALAGNTGATLRYSPAASATWTCAAEPAVRMRRGATVAEDTGTGRRSDAPTLRSQRQMHKQTTGFNKLEYRYRYLSAKHALEPPQRQRSDAFEVNTGGGAPIVRAGTLPNFGAW